MDERERVARRLLDALIASGEPFESIEQYCQTIEAGVVARHETTIAAARIANTPVQWNELFAEDSAPANWLYKKRITTFGVIQMLSRRDLYYVPNIGTKRLKLIERFLAGIGHGLRLRGVGESFVKRAEQVYGSIERVPVTVLMIRHGYEPWHAALLDRLRLATIGDLRRYATETDLVWQGWDKREESFLSMLYREARPNSLARKR